jgi:hypothetical protein
LRWQFLYFLRQRSHRKPVPVTEVCALLPIP